MPRTWGKDQIFGFYYTTRSKGEVKVDFSTNTPPNVCLAPGS